MEGEDDIRELVRRAQSGDEDAMARIFEVVEPTMRHVARGFADPARPDESVSDLLQEAKLRAWQRIGQFEGVDDDGPATRRGPSTENDAAPDVPDAPAVVLRAWIARMVRRIGLSHVEARAAQKRRAPHAALVRLGGGGGGGGASSVAAPGARASDIAASDPSASEEARRREREGLIRDALEACDDIEGRDLVRLCFFDGLSLRAAAVRMNVPYPRARERYHATLRRLERLLRGRL